jgi:hypothetical protein
MTFNPTEIAEKALTQPSDSYFGNDNLWTTHGMSGFSKNRDSGCLEIANFKTVIHILENEFGPQDTNGLWWINYSTHWAVGWVDQIMVKIIINQENRIDDINNITDIFKRCLEIHDELEVDPVLDEQIYSEILDEVTINNIIAPQNDAQKFGTFDVRKKYVVSNCGRVNPRPKISPPIHIQLI